MRGAEAPGRGLDQGDLIHATLRNFSPSHRLGGRLLCVWGGVLPVVFPSGSEPKRGSLVGRARGFLLLPLAACIVSEEGSHVRGGYPFDYYLFDYYPFDGYPIKPNHPNHNHSIFCLLSLTPDATNTMRFCSGFIFSIRTRRHLVLTPTPKTHPPSQRRRPCGRRARASCCCPAPRR